MRSGWMSARSQGPWWHGEQPPTVAEQVPQQGLQGQHSNLINTKKNPRASKTQARCRQTAR